VKIRVWRIFQVVSLSAVFMGTVLTGVALANGHTVNGIYHGPYFESRPNWDYHHCWTEHSHTGYKYAQCETNDPGGGHTLMCYASNFSQEYITHVHCTVLYEGKGAGLFVTSTGTPCPFSEGGYAAYADGHGICYHHRNE